MQRANDCHLIAKRNTGSFLFLHIVKILFFQIVLPNHIFCKLSNQLTFFANVIVCLYFQIDVLFCPIIDSYNFNI